MFGDSNNDGSFEDMVRSMAREAAKSLERAIDSVDFDAMADAIGVDPSVTRDWVQSTSSWLRENTENLADAVAPRPPDDARPPDDVRPQDEATPPRRPAAAPSPASNEPFYGAGPHPLDLPTDEQGLALAALTSGRWTVEPGTVALGAKGDGPAPSNALGVVRELRVRDWITPDGELTLVGSRALGRWLDAAARA